MGLRQSYWLNRLFIFMVTTVTTSVVKRDPVTVPLPSGSFRLTSRLHLGTDFFMSYVRGELRFLPHGFKLRNFRFGADIKVVSFISC